MRKVAANLADLCRELTLDRRVCLGRSNRAQTRDLACSGGGSVIEIGSEGNAGCTGLRRKDGELLRDLAYLVGDLRFDLVIGGGGQDGGKSRERAVVLLGVAGVCVCIGGGRCGGSCGGSCGLRSGEGEEGDNWEDFETHLDCVCRLL